MRPLSALLNVCVPLINERQLVNNFALFTEIQQEESNARSPNDLTGSHNLLGSNENEMQRGQGNTIATEWSLNGHIARMDAGIVWRDLKTTKLRR